VRRAGACDGRQADAPVVVAMIWVRSVLRGAFTWAGTIFATIFIVEAMIVFFADFSGWGKTRYWQSTRLLDLFHDQGSWSAKIHAVGIAQLVAIIKHWPASLVLALLGLVSGMLALWLVIEE
jgi:hypothetical protein